MTSRRDRLLVLNDSRLTRYLSAQDEVTRTVELGRILDVEVRERASSILRGYVRTGWPLVPADIDDIAGQVTVNMLRKLLALTVIEEESVQNLEAYVVTLTRNCVRNFMRTRSPERARMKARFRYLFMQDERLAMWTRDRLTLVGLAPWSNTGRAQAEEGEVRAAVTEEWSDDRPPVERILRILRRVGRPVNLSHFLSACMSLESHYTPPEPVSEPATDRHEHIVEARQYLRILWSEIQTLPPAQRAALLLNLREPGSGNALTLFLSSRIASLREIAESVSMSAEELNGIWEELPLDDLRIATVLGRSRQQVINLRKSARERLTRRMTSRTLGRQ
jgi:DNA-directed RNA polymerase specialized sigma24 family protein